MNRQEAMHAVVKEFVRLFDGTPYGNKTERVRSSLQCAKDFILARELPPTEFFLDIMEFVQTYPPEIDSHEVEAALVSDRPDLTISLLAKARFLNECSALYNKIFEAYAYP